MPRGPRHQRLADYVDNAHPEALDDAATQWKTGMGLLRQISQELLTRASGMKHAESYGDGEIWSGETASTAREAFSQSSTAMQDKSEEMQQGSDAFAAAADGVRAARGRLRTLDHADPGPKPTAPTFSPGPRSHADEVKQSQYDTSASRWQRDYHANEIAADAAITDLQANHKEQSKVFRRIAGLPEERPRKKTQQHTDNPVDTGNRPASTHVPTTVVRHGHVGDGIAIVDDSSTGGDQDPHPGITTQPGGGSTGPGGTDPHPGGGIGPHPGGGIGPHPGTGVPQGPSTTPPIGPLTPGAAAPHGGAGAIGGVGAAAGGAFGAAAAAGLAGGLNGGLSGLSPVAAGWAGRPLGQRGPGDRGHLTHRRRVGPRPGRRRHGRRAGRSRWHVLARQGPEWSQRGRARQPGQVGCARRGHRRGPRRQGQGQEARRPGPGPLRRGAGLARRRGSARAHRLTSVAVGHSLATSVRTS